MEKSQSGKELVWDNVVILVHILEESRKIKLIMV